MFRFSFNVINPFYKGKSSDFLNVYEWELDLTENKAYEFQVSYCNRDLFEIALDAEWIGKDHAGIEFELCLFGYSTRFNLYDKRHWNHYEGRWMTKEESKYSKRRK